MKRGDDGRASQALGAAFVDDANQRVSSLELPKHRFPLATACKAGRWPSCSRELARTTTSFVRVTFVVERAIDDRNVRLLPTLARCWFDVMCMDTDKRRRHPTHPCEWKYLESQSKSVGWTIIRIDSIQPTDVVNRLLFACVVRSETQCMYETKTKARRGGQLNDQTKEMPRFALVFVRILRMCGKFS